MPERDRTGWGVVATAAFGLALGYSTYISYVFGMFTKPLGETFDWTRSQIALALTLCNWVVMVVSPLSGWVLDRLGARRMLLPSVVLLTVALFALALQPGDLRVFYAIHLALPIAAAGTLPAVYTRAVVGWFDRRRGMALGLALAGVGLGGMALPPALQAVIDAYGWRAAYGALGGVMLVCVLPVLSIWFRDKPEFERRAQTSVDASGLTLHEAIRTRSFWLLNAIFAALGTMTLGLSVSLVPLLTDSGIPGAAAAAFASTLAAGVLVGRLTSGLLLDRFFAPYVAFGCLSAATVGLSGLAVGVAASSGTLTGICLLLVGFGVGAEFDFMSYFISRYLGLRAYGRIYGWTYAAFQLGGGIGPLIMAASHDQLGDYSPALGLLCVCTGAAATLFLLFKRQPLTRPATTFG